MEIVDHVTFLKLPFERLEHYRTDLPVLIPTDAPRDLSLLDANVSNHRNRFVIVPEIAQGRPVLVILSSQTSWQNEKHDENFEPGAHFKEPACVRSLTTSSC